MVNTEGDPSIAAVQSATPPIVPPKRDVVKDAPKTEPLEMYEEPKKTFKDHFAAPVNWFKSRFGSNESKDKTEASHNKESKDGANAQAKTETKATSKLEANTELKLNAQIEHKTELTHVKVDLKPEKNVDLTPAASVEPKEVKHEPSVKTDPIPASPTGTASAKANKLNDQSALVPSEVLPITPEVAMLTYSNSVNKQPESVSPTLPQTPLTTKVTTQLDAQPIDVHIKSVANELVNHAINEASELKAETDGVNEFESAVDELEAELLNH